MLRWRRSGMALMAVGLVVGSAVVGGRSTTTESAARAAAESIGTPERIQIFYTPPVLVRAGEPARIPVDVICATAGGRPCAANLTFGSRAGAERWHVATVGSAHQATFDLAAPAARAATTASSGSVSFYLRAQAGGVAAEMPPGQVAEPLRFYVARDMPASEVPSIPFGQVRRGRSVLFLPWGSGGMKAGLALGNESATLGPSACDVDRSGRIFVLDPLQHRLAVFAEGRLVRSTTVNAGPRADLAINDAGAAFIAGGAQGHVAVQPVSSTGTAGASSAIGDGILSEIRTDGSQAFVNMLPVDAWVRFGTSPSTATVGRPVAGGAQLLRVDDGQSIRLGTVRGGGVTNAVELRAHERFGDLAMAEPDGAGGYWVVTRVWRAQPAAEQYQAIHVSNGRIAASFAIRDESFAETPPSSRFRLGHDGNLYQLTTSPDGMRIVRFDLGGQS